MTAKADIVVIGGGVGGLAAAARLTMTAQAAPDRGE